MSKTTPGLEDPSKSSGLSGNSWIRGYNGVYRAKNDKYRAAIQCSGAWIQLGLFDSLFEAAYAVNVGVIVYGAEYELNRNVAGHDEMAVWLLAYVNGRDKAKWVVDELNSRFDSMLDADPRKAFAAATSLGLWVAQMETKKYGVVTVLFDPAQSLQCQADCVRLFRKTQGERFTVQGDCERFTDFDFFEYARDVVRAKLRRVSLSADMTSDIAQLINEYVEYDQKQRHGKRMMFQALERAWADEERVAYEADVAEAAFNEFVRDDVN